MSVVVEKYSEKSIIVKGNTKLYKSNLMELGGKWNPTLQGWIFASSKKETVDKVNKLVDDINNDKSIGYDEGDNDHYESLKVAIQEAINDLN